MRGAKLSNHTIRMLNHIQKSTKGKKGYTVTMNDLVEIYANEYGYNTYAELQYLGLSKKSFQKLKNMVVGAIRRYNDRVFDAEKIHTIQDNIQDRNKLFYMI